MLSGACMAESRALRRLRARGLRKTLDSLPLLVSISPAAACAAESCPPEGGQRPTADPKANRRNFAFTSPPGFVEPLDLHTCYTPWPVLRDVTDGAGLITTLAGVYCSGREDLPSATTKR